MSYRLYPVNGKKFVCEDYRVRIDGQEAPFDAARVSAYPMNRRWPGCQRQIEQSELINFLSFAMDGPVTLEIFPPEPFETVMLRPQNARIPYEITEQGTILLRLDEPRYFTVEPYGRNRALHILPMLCRAMISAGTPRTQSGYPGCFWRSSSGGYHDSV